MPWKLCPVDRFSEIANVWDSMQARSGSIPFLARPFIKPLLEEFGTGRELVALYEDGGEFSEAAILAPVRFGIWQTFQPAQLPLGAWMSTGRAELSARCASLIAALPGFALGVGLTQQDPLFRERPADGPCLRTSDYISTAWVDIDGNFDLYWEARGKNLKQNMRKQRNKLQTEGVSLSLEMITDPADLADAINDFGALESAGWKADGGTAIHADNPQGRFYRAMLENFCATGKGRIYRYRFNERIVAMDLCIDNGSTMVILKTTYDESYKNVSPAFLMRQDQFRQLFEEGHFKRIEFYGKVMEWHTRWTDNSRLLYHVTAYRWPPLLRSHAWLVQRRERRAAGSRGAATVASTDEGAGAGDR